MVEHKVFFKEYLNNDRNRAELELLRLVVSDLKFGLSNMYVTFLEVTGENAGTCKSFTNAFCEVQGIIKETTGIEPIILPIGYIFKEGLSILENFLDEGAHRIPRDPLQCGALKDLLEFLKSTCDHSSVLIESKVKGELDSHIALRFAQHLMVPLASKKAFIIDNSYSGSSPESCRGDTSFGCKGGWHGKADILIVNEEVSCTVLDSCPESDVLSSCSDSSNEVESSDTLNQKALVQMLAQTIVFSFLQHKNYNGALKNYLIPGIGISAEKLHMFFYECQEDVLLQTCPIDLFLLDGQKINFEAVVVLWLTLNYRLFCTGIPDPYKVFKSKFHQKIGDKNLQMYREDVDRCVHVNSCEWKYEIPQYIGLKPHCLLESTVFEEKPDTYILLGD